MENPRLLTPALQNGRPRPKPSEGNDNLAADFDGIWDWLKGLELCQQEWHRGKAGSPGASQIFL